MPGFSKDERLYHYRLRQLLFAGRHDLFCFPFKIKYLAFACQHENEIIQPFPARQQPEAFHEQVTSTVFPVFPARCLITVSSKRFRLATRRNRIKRLVREAYRKNKNALYVFLNQKGMHCLVAFTYIAPEILPFSEIESKMDLSLQQLIKRLGKESAETWK